MPPEPLPSSSDPAGAVPVPTTPSSHYNNHGPFSSDFCRPFSGQVNGGWHVTTWQDKFSQNSNNDCNGGNFRETTASPNDNSHPQSDLSNSWDQGVQRLEKENSLPLKWSRSGSLASRGSGFSHLSIGVDSVDVKINGQTGNVTPLQSPSDAAAVDDVSSRKKARLGWGEGLAKYEKKKVGPDDDKEGGGRNGIVDEGLHQSPVDKSPSLTECASPVTPYCSSSPGIEEKSSVKAAEVDNDLCNPCQGPAFNLEAVNMTSLLSELLQSDETNTQASGFLKSTAMDKLHIWKADISRTLEITESEIDSKSFLSDVVVVGGSSPSCSLTNNNTEEKSENMSTEKAVEEHEHNGVADLDRQSPATSTSFTSCDNLTPLDIRSEPKCPQDDVSNKFPELFALNKVDANESHDELANVLLPTTQCCTNIKASTNTNDSLIKERFTMKKRFLKFKEKVTTLKFRAFQYVWKEDLRLLSVRKSSGSKSHKKFESSSRFSSPVGNLSLVPTNEIIEYANKLLSDSQTKIYQNTLKMPSLILDKSERVTSRFISDNGLVEDPCEVEKERSHGNHWTSQEKEIFLEKFSLFGKDFKKISSFLDCKTVADCVEFYYKNHKSERFQKTKKHSSKSSITSTYLVTSGKRWSRETNAAASLEILSAMADDVDSQSQRKLKGVHGGVVDERETAAADVLAGICGSISSEALSSCITSLVDSPDVYNHNKLGGGYSSRRQVAARGDADVETCSDDSCGGEIEMMNHADWTDGEKSCFIQAVRNYGKDFTMISKSMKTRSRDECKVYYSKGRKCLGLDEIHVDGKAGPDHEYDNDDGHDDTCMVDSGSVISCDKSSSEIKMEVEDLHSSDSKQEVVESEQITVNVCEPTGEEAPQTEKVDTLDLSNNSVNNNNGFQAIRDSPIHRKTHSQDDISSRLSFRKSGGFQRSSSTDGYHLHLPKHSLMDCVESSSHVLRVPSLQICTTTLTQKQSSDVGEKSGDVKLFGQILTKPKSNGTGGLQESVEKSLHLKFDNNKGLSEVPLRRSYGFWDGNRIQTGFPDSSILLAKYPSAYGNNGVSDPVAAIRMHYAKTEQYNNGSSGAV